VPRATALVDGVERVSHPGGADVARERAPAQYLTVAFGSGRAGLLDMTTHQSRVWAEVLESFRETGRLAYVEIDPNTSVITQVLQPIPYRVGRIARLADRLQVELIISHARHFLRRSNPDFEEFREVLEGARQSGTSVLVTETLVEHEIIDARPVPGEPAPAPRQARRR
jgi:sugar phosphate isomerase/epimerase